MNYIVWLPVGAELQSPQTHEADVGVQFSPIRAEYFLFLGKIYATFRQTLHNTGKSANPQLKASQYAYGTARLLVPLLLCTDSRILHEKLGLRHELFNI